MRRSRRGKPSKPKSPAKKTLLEPIAKQGQGKQVEVDGRELALTNLDKVLWPPRRGGRGGSRPAFTKGEAIDYYARIARHDPPPPRRPPADPGPVPRRGRGPAILREARAPRTRRTGSARRRSRWDRRACSTSSSATSAPTLIWLAQLAALELHPSLVARRSAPSARPCSPSTSTRASRRPRSSARGWRCACASCSTSSASSASPKHSGSKGIQVYVPLNTPVTYERTKPYARAVAQALERAEPDARRLASRTKELRKGKVLVDWSQNDYSKTTVAVYSLRCRPAALGLDCR